MKPILKALSLSTLLLSSQLFAHNTSEQNFGIAIHGGAGTINQAKMTTEKRRQYEQGLQAAIDAGYDVLKRGGNSEQAVITAISILEDNPLFNAGKGAVYTYQGTHELDASIMNGDTLQAGAVAGVKTVKNPIKLASGVMHNSVHVLLSGDGAEQFAKHQGLELVDNKHFDTERRYKSLLKAKEKLRKKQQELKDFQAAHQSLDNEFKMGTVGAVALDKQGNLTAGTSTGGMTAKRYGRIGDSPIIGAGTYANNASCAVSATGHGEYFIRYTVASSICKRMEYLGETVEQAASYVINTELKNAGGNGGVVVIDHQGNISMPFNTSGMYRASKSANGKTKVAIFKGE